MSSQPQTALNPAQVDAVLRAGVLFHQRGWVPATAGNFSFRIDAQRAAVTASGRHKGELRPQDLLAVDLQGQVLNDERSASAETLLHCALYRRSPGIGAVLHTHSPAATLLSRHCDSVRLEGYELLKIFEGIDTHEAYVELPVFENDQDLQRLSAVVDASMDTGRAAHAYLIRGHGMYTWGRTVEEARYRVEAVEFLLDCAWQYQLKRGETS